MCASTRGGSRRALPWLSHGSSVKVVRTPASPMFDGKPAYATLPEVTVCSTFAVSASSISATVASYRSVPP